jgi:hypothetical protein
LLLLLVSSLGVAAQQTWLPPAMQEGAIGQLVERLTAITQPRDARVLAQGAQKMVLAVQGTLDTWTAAGTLKRAPSFPQLTVPGAGERHLDAMARYQLCNVVLMRQFESGADEDTRQAGALGLTAITLALLHLRQPYVAGGGSDAGMEAALTSAPMARLFEQMQSAPALLTHVETRCEPVVQELLSAAF